VVRTQGFANFEAEGQGGNQVSGVLSICSLAVTVESPSSFFVYSERLEGRLFPGKLSRPFQPGLRKMTGRRPVIEKSGDALHDFAFVFWISQ
jgi:hypothetical protein